MRIFLAFILLFLFSNKSYAANPISLKIASWNLWDFSGGPAGAWKVDENGACLDFVCQAYKDVIVDGKYEIVFVQEIRSKNDENNNYTYPAFDDLCQNYLGSDYSCYAMPASIRTCRAPNEAYGVIIANEAVEKYNIELDIQPTNVGGMTRPPMLAKMKITKMSGADTNINFLNNHTCPSNVAGELIDLQNYVGHTFNLNKDNVVILGDLNAAGRHFPHQMLRRLAIFAEDWFWLIEDYMPTNFLGASRGAYDPNVGYAYDRIILSKSLENFYDNNANSPVGYINLGNVDNIPKDLTNVPSPRGTENGTAVEGDIIPAGTYFKDVAWYGRKGANPNSQVYGLSDHRLVWFNLLIGGVDSDQNIYNDFQTCSQNPDSLKEVNLIGYGFPSDLRNVRAYVVRHNSFMRKPENYNLYTAITSERIATDASGVITRTSSNETAILWGAPTAGRYNIIIDMNNNGHYESNIDIIDNRTSYGFEVQPCNNDISKPQKVSVEVPMNIFNRMSAW